jgi:type IV pilus assembly protein PilA
MKTLVSLLTVCAVGLPLLGAGCGSDEKAEKKKREKAEEAEEESKPRFSSAELSEAKNSIGAIARGAVGAFERETMAADGTSFEHALCKSATAVPAKLPEKKEKVTTADTDWGGDATTGWKCLKFIITNPVRFQYSYIVGGPYKGDGRAKDPGADGFQICAEADIEPGGKTTLVCQTGKVDKATNVVKLATEQEVLLE